MRCPKFWDTETSRNTAFSSNIFRRPKNLGHRIWRRMPEIAVTLDLTRGTLDPVYGTVSPHYVFPCPPQQTNGGGPGNHCCGSQTPILGAEETNVGGQETNAWVTGDPCLEANQPIVGDQVTNAWGENIKCWGPRKKCLKSGRSMGAGQEGNCWGQGNQLVVPKRSRGVWGPEINWYASSVWAAIVNFFCL